MMLSHQNLLINGTDSIVVEGRTVQIERARAGAGFRTTRTVLSSTSEALRLMSNLKSLLSHSV